MRSVLGIVLIVLIFAGISAYDSVTEKNETVTQSTEQPRRFKDSFVGQSKIGESIHFDRPMVSIALDDCPSCFDSLDGRITRFLMPVEESYLPYADMFQNEKILRYESMKTEYRILSVTKSASVWGTSEVAELLGDDNTHYGIMAFYVEEPALELAGLEKQYQVLFRKLEEGDDVKLSVWLYNTDDRGGLTSQDTLSNDPMIRSVQVAERQAKFFDAIPKYLDIKIDEKNEYHLSVTLIGTVDVLAYLISEKDSLGIQSISELIEE